MIRVQPAPEPGIFDDRVRQPGEKFLNSVPKGQKANFRYREYWRRILDEIHRAYGGICSYTCHYVPLDTGADTVEHFVPRDVDPSLAYEWDNFRFVCGRMNGRKSKYTDVVDPFAVVTGMFELSFPSLQVDVGSGMSGLSAALAATTITRLGLNKERNVRARAKYILDYRDDKISEEYLESHAPFLHSELKRQKISRADLSVLMPNKTV
jgi:hypothetical protein